jgi:RNA polymerase sigma-70 factor (ECF subfamily)
MMTLYYNDLFRYGIRFTADKDLTKDIIGQFFLHVWDHRNKFCAAENIKCYLIVSFKRFMISYLKKIARQLDIPTNEDGFEYSYEDYIIAWQDEERTRTMLLAIIQSLPPRQKELVRLRFYEQLTFEEIALKTSLSLRTVYNKLHEALKNIRQHALTGKFRNK